MLDFQELRRVCNREFHLLDIKKFYIMPTQSVSYDFHKKTAIISLNDILPTSCHKTVTQHFFC